MHHELWCNKICLLADKAFYSNQGTSYLAKEHVDMLILVYQTQYKEPFPEICFVQFLTDLAAAAMG